MWDVITKLKDKLVNFPPYWRSFAISVFFRLDPPQQLYILKDLKIFSEVCDPLKPKSEESIRRTMGTVDGDKCIYLN